MKWEAVSWSNGKATVYASGQFRIVRPHYQGGLWALDIEGGKPIAFGTFEQMKAKAASMGKPLIEVLSCR